MNPYLAEMIVHLIQEVKEQCTKEGSEFPPPLLVHQIARELGADIGHIPKRTNHNRPSEVSSSQPDLVGIK